jgi:hypothetical protein
MVRVNTVSDKIDNPNFLNTGHRVDWYFRLLIVTVPCIGYLDDQKRLGAMACDNVSIVENQIRLRLIPIVDSERVLNPYPIPAFPLIRKNLGKRVDNRPVIQSEP